jgi:hypothetical protein
MLQELFLSAQPIPSLGLLVFFFIIENDHEVSCLQDKIYLDALLGSCCFWVQALSSYVLIATNVLLCTSPPSQQNLLELVLPAILPYMTTHHHNLRSFAQVQQCTVKPCPLMFWWLMIPKKGCWKRKEKKLSTLFQATNGLSQCKAFCVG